MTVELPTWSRVHITPEVDRAMAREQGVLVATIQIHRSQLVSMGLLRQDECGAWWLKRGAL